MAKKHAPIEELRIAGQVAKERLITLGVIDESMDLQLIEKEFNILLPGIPSYLPHKWTIRTAQRMMYNLIRIWQSETDEKNQDNLPQFVEFAIKEMKRLEDIAQKKMNTMESKIKNLDEDQEVPVLGEIFAPINQYENTKTINLFFVHSFATCIAANGEASTVSEFVEWFYDWTDKMYEIWEKKKSQ